MKRSAKLVAAMSLVAAGFVVGALVAVQRGWTSDVVTTFVTNDTNQELRSAAILVSTCGSSISPIQVGPLAPGKSRKVQYSVCGEGGYSAEAITEDGATIKGRGMYVESGHRVEMRITKDTITSSYRYY